MVVGTTSLAKIASDVISITGFPLLSSAKADD